MSVSSIIQNIERRRNRVLNGEVNCIPIPFERVRQSFPGIEQKRYYLISGAAKSAKTQITSLMFLFTPILYAYYHPDKVRVKIFYFPLEETEEDVTERFMSYLLYMKSGGKIAKSSTDLNSTDERFPIEEDIIEKLKSEDYQKILRFYEENVFFMEEKNPTGIYKQLTHYAEQNGTFHKKKMQFVNKATGALEEKEVFDYYEPYDKDEYVIVITDHVSLINTEGGLDLRESINKFSNYMIDIRNKYSYIPVVVQQQNTDTISAEAVRSKHIIPTLNGLADSKAPGKDCNMFIGMTHPYSFGNMASFAGYDTGKMKNNFRLITIVLNRNGNSNGSSGLYFNGKCCVFKELPEPDNPDIKNIYNWIDEQHRLSKVFMIFSKFKSLWRT